MRSHRPLVLALLCAVPAAARADATACKTGALVFGDPLFKDNDAPNPKGQTVKQDPPLEWRALVFSKTKGRIYTVSGGSQEIWGGEVAGAIKRVTGEKQEGSPKDVDGACPAARFQNVWGIAEDKSGALVVADRASQKIKLVADPVGPGCTVTTLVGAAGAGDGDGAGKDARVGGPAWPTLDASENVYFIDTVAGKLKVMAPDAAHTVTTVAALKSSKAAIVSYTGITLLGGKVYVVANTFTSGVVFEVEPETKKVRTLYEAGDSGFPGLANTAPSLSSVTNDGKALLLTGQGYIWRLPTTGKNIALLGGTGFSLDYPPNYNPAGPYPLKNLALRFRSDDSLSGGTSTVLLWLEDALYFRGRHRGAYVLKIGCP